MNNNWEFNGIVRARARKKTLPELCLSMLLVISLCRLSPQTFWFCVCPSQPSPPATASFCFKGIIGRCRYWINELDASLIHPLEAAHGAFDQTKCSLAPANSRHCINSPLPSRSVFSAVFWLKSKRHRPGHSFRKGLKKFSRYLKANSLNIPPSHPRLQFSSGTRKKKMSKHSRTAQKINFAFSFRGTFDGWLNSCFARRLFSFASLLWLIPWVIRKVIKGRARSLFRGRLLKARKSLRIY